MRAARKVYNHPVQFGHVVKVYAARPCSPLLPGSFLLDAAFGFRATVYLHIIWFAAWFGLRVKPYPFGLLTMIMSLKAMFVSTS